MQKIILIRHTTPLINYGICSYKEAKLRLNEYNQTSKLKLDEISILEGAQNELAVEIIYTSPLIRAKKTAESLFPSHKITTNEQLIEYDLEIFPIPLIKLPFKTWLLISRILWLLGINKSKRNFSQEKQRVQNFIARNLNQDCIIISHGFVLHQIKSFLLKNSFTTCSLIKQGCFSFHILEKEKGN